MNSDPILSARSLCILTQMNLRSLARKLGRTNGSRRNGAIGWYRLCSLEFQFRVSIRTVTDVTFPGVVSFPFRKRLTLIGAFEDSTLPALHVIDEKETWGVVAEEGIEEEELLKFDGVCNENAPQFRRTKTVEITRHRSRRGGVFRG